MFDKWDKRFMELAKLVGSWSSCYKANRKIGTVVVKDKRVLTTGYNGAPSGIKSCVERQECIRQKNNIESGKNAEFCYAVHSEQNAIIQGAKLGISLDGATLYCTHQPCSMCTRQIINAGIKRIVYQNPYPDEFSLKLLQEAGVKVEIYEEETNN
ncbi:MAG: deoxycytidylate deaminase [Christensenellales bacterium]